MREPTPLMRAAGIELPVICGAMYPCSNPELVAAVSEAGGIGIVQPVSLTYVHGYEYNEGLRLIRRLTQKPVGFNALIESRARSYHERMVRWVHGALEHGIRFFITSLGNPRWVVDAVHATGGVVYHDVTERKWALKGRDEGVDGLIAVNSRAGGHAGSRDPRALFDEVADLGLPVVAAGGIATAADLNHVLDIGYAGVQMGTRFIATVECSASDAYKQAIVDADADDIVLTERLTGVPLAVINTPFVRKLGTRIGPVSRALFRGRRTKHWMRALYAMRAARSFKRSLHADAVGRDYWQAGRSVAGIDRVLPVAEVMASFRDALAER